MHRREIATVALSQIQMKARACTVLGACRNHQQPLTCKKVGHVPDEGEPHTVRAEGCFNKGQAPGAQGKAN